MKHIVTDSYGLTDQGKKRDENQDQFFIARLDKTVTVEKMSTFLGTSPPFESTCGRLYLVADGMGGHQGGKEASAIAVETILQYAATMMPWFFSLNHHDSDVRDELKGLLKRCEENIVEAAQNEPRLRNMGTTVTMAYTCWPKLYVVHVGDSRCYLSRAGRLERVTHDHTMAEKMVARGALEREAAEETRWSNVLCNVVGGRDTSEQASPEVYEAKLVPGDKIMLCSDGLTKHISEEEISKILAAEVSAEESCCKLVKRALDEGGSDNVTVVVARFVNNT